MSELSGVNKDIQKIVKAARKQGAEVSSGGKHLHLTFPSGRTIPIPKFHRNNGNGVRDFQKQVERGFR